MNIPDALPVLSKGHHLAGSGRACVMDAVSWLSGKPQEGDAPSCVHPVLRSAAIRVNDLLPDSDRHRLWALVPRLIGTAPDGLDPHAEKVLSVRLAVWCAREVLPLAPEEYHRAVCERAIAAAEGWCEGRVSAEECRTAAEASSSCCAAAASSYGAMDAAWTAAEAARAASWAAAAYAAATAAARAAAYAAAAYAAAGAAAHAADCAASAAWDAATAARLALLDGLIGEHERLTGHQPHPVTQTQWDTLTDLLGATT